MTVDATPTTEVTEVTETVTVSETETPQPDDKRRNDVPPEVQAALRKANKEAETLRRRIQEFEDRDKTESQKLADRLTEAEQRATAAESALLRKTVALTKGLPPELVDRLQGSTEEELAADADALLALLAPAAREGDIVQPSAFIDLGQGTRGGGDMALNGDPLLKTLKEKLGVR